MPRPLERGRELESGREAERGREMESTEAPRAERQRGMWMDSEAEPNSRWQNGHGRMRGRPLIGPPAARGGAGADWYVRWLAPTNVDPTREVAMRSQLEGGRRGAASQPVGAAVALQSG